MNSIGSRLVAGFSAAAMVLALAGIAANADTQHKSVPPQVKSSTPDAPFIGRVVVTPTAEQLAWVRAQKRANGAQTRALVAQQAGGGNSATANAL